MNAEPVLSMQGALADWQKGGEIRLASAADIDALKQLINAAFIVEQVAIAGDRVDGPKLEALFRTGKFLLLERDSILQGCVYVEKRGERAYLGLLAVDPLLQKKGLGLRLMAEAESHLEAAGCRAVDLRVISARPELLSFYGKLGYVQTGTSPMPRDAPLKAPCEFIHLSKTLGRSARQS